MNNSNWEKTINNNNKYVNYVIHYKVISTGGMGIERIEQDKKDLEF